MFFLYMLLLLYGISLAYDVLDYINLFFSVDPACIPGVNPIWSRRMILFIHCWIRFANILLRIFASMLVRDIGL